MRTFKMLMAAVVFAAPVLASIPAHPGMLNYVEGEANIDGRPVTNQAVGSADVQQGQVIETGNGKSEILLTPGVFLRLGNKSALRMVNPGLADTTVELLHGEAMVEATDVQRGNNLRVIDRGVSTRLDKNGLYGFDDTKIAVYEGEATVGASDHSQKLKKGKEADLASLQVTKFDTKQGDELYRWSDLRSGYLSEASVATARTVVVEPAFGAGWFWNPWYGYYTFLPGPGLIYSPFGWGFYGPRAVAIYGGAHRFVSATRPIGMAHPAFVGRAGFRAGRR
jgi:hypothetical protein